MCSSLFTQLLKLVVVWKVVW